jgi:hypothetical protein
MQTRVYRLVAALQANTHVSSLELYGWHGSRGSDFHYTYDLQSDKLHSFRTLLSFLRHSQSLRSVKLRSFSACRLHDLLVAISANPNIVTLDLWENHETLSIAIENLAPSLTSLKRLGMPVPPDEPDDDVRVAEEVTELVLSLKTLEYLELDFTLDSTDMDSEWRRFRAIARVVDHPTVTDLSLQLPFDANHDAIIHNLSSLLVSTNILTMKIPPLRLWMLCNTTGPLLCSPSTTAFFSTATGQFLLSLNSSKP